MAATMSDTFAGETYDRLEELLATLTSKAR